MHLPDDRAIVVCIGNELVADDAAGYEVYRRLPPLPARLEYLGVGGFDLLPLLHGERHLIVVDAVQLGEAPGTVHVIPWQRLPEAGPEISVHGVGLRETIEIGKILFPEQMPEQVTLVGIEGRCFDRTREFMTGAVAGAIDPALEAVRRLVQGGVHE
ncbi:methyl viologen-reducing hydrogenase maturation protease [Citrifermentans bemidjiense Bem]|uniref:Methyl viologen-reducing hydrogenase maturation protease n=1 Tax=Citrifermentans bemidjiense (strain ATCC BAA-1014 / DSM 16622 / JCM 12645 / Bem) TaxID=404380 RepID=B5EFB8_CITBB|nr:hydrogenase maturation protease [Citrifermentans bemidjiense]ACH40873.1 methyl viologen-reducing hydrogenase maturation protease [Citrifermentans bemidjiense Bem]